MRVDRINYSGNWNSERGCKNVLKFRLCNDVAIGTSGPLPQFKYIKSSGKSFRTTILPYDVFEPV